MCLKIQTPDNHQTNKNHLHWRMPGINYYWYNPNGIWTPSHSIQVLLPSISLLSCYSVCFLLFFHPLTRKQMTIIQPCVSACSWGLKEGFRTYFHDLLVLSILIHSMCCVVLLHPISSLVFISFIYYNDLGNHVPGLLLGAHVCPFDRPNSIMSSHIPSIQDMILPLFCECCMLTYFLTLHSIHLFCLDSILQGIESNEATLIRNIDKVYSKASRSTTTTTM